MKTFKQKERNIVLKSTEREVSRPKSKVWIPIKGDRYCFIDANGKVHICIWKGTNIDAFRYKTDNCFKTFTEAQFKIERLRVTRDLKAFATEYNKEIDWKNHKQAKWRIVFKHETGELGVEDVYSWESNDIYFTSEELAKDAIWIIGADDIIKYFLGK